MISLVFSVCDGRIYFCVQYFSIVCDLPVSRADSVLVFEMRSQSVRRSVYLSTLGAGTGVCGPHAEQVLGPSAASCNENYTLNRHVESLIV